MNKSIGRCPERHHKTARAAEAQWIGNVRCVAEERSSRRSATHPKSSQSRAKARGAICQLEKEVRLRLNTPNQGTKNALLDGTSTTRDMRPQDLQMPPAPGRSASMHEMHGSMAALGILAWGLIALLTVVRYDCNTRCTPHSRSTRPGLPQVDRVPDPC